ncbi:MAG: MFS transporter [Brevibacterium yomogidense]|uniref:Transporter, putative n=1 Tax=Brevibacterium yomogidense TaxID=946573 RepID=A0A1X6XMG8_9MICO|nr:MFS transporter [Brevibacterium yomogidense]SLN00471.1 transporter, putative [Brevibacterium yomogidense]
MTSMFRSLAEPNYRKWFGGALVSNTGTWMQRTAQDWIVLTQLTDEDATALGITMALQLGPQLVLFPVAGTIADRFQRRRLLLITQILMGTMGLVLFVLTVTGAIQLWHVYLLALALGIVATVDNPARQTFVSELVGDSLVANAVSLNSASFNTARMLGPAVAGVLTAAIGASTVFLLSGLAFAGTVGVLLSLDRSRLQSPDARTRRAPGRGIMGGFRYLRTRPDIIVVLAVIFVVSTFGIKFNIFTATMARVEFGRDASAFGLLNSILAVGSLTGALLAARRDRPRLRTVFWAAGAFGAACAAASVMPNYWTFALTLTTLGLSSITMLTAANAYVQTTTPSGVRGRIMSIYAAVVLGGAPLGAPFAGWIADQFGPRAALGVGAAAGAVGILIGVVWMVSAKHMRVHYVRRSRRFIRLSYDGRKSKGRGSASPVRPEPEG